MHVSAAAGAQAVGMTDKFPQQKVQIHAAHDQRGSAAMIERKRVTFTYLQNRTCHDGFFARAHVHLAGYFARLPYLSNRFLEPTASQHMFV
jgi:hypothetical protein